MRDASEIVLDSLMMQDSTFDVPSVKARGHAQIDFGTGWVVKAGITLTHFETQGKFRLLERDAAYLVGDLIPIEAVEPGCRWNLPAGTSLRINASEDMEPLFLRVVTLSGGADGSEPPSTPSRTLYDHLMDPNE